jgi:hypothetical protein
MPDDEKPPATPEKPADDEKSDEVEVPKDDEAKLQLIIALVKSIPISWYIPLLILGGPSLGVYLAQYLELATQDEIVALQTEQARTTEAIGQIREEMKKDRAKREEILSLVKQLAKAPAPQPDP